MTVNCLSSRASILFSIDLLTILGILITLSIVNKLNSTLLFTILSIIIIFGIIIRDLYSLTHKTNKIHLSLLQGLIIGYIPAFLLLYLCEICIQSNLINPFILNLIIIICSLFLSSYALTLVIFNWNRNSKDILEGLFIALIIGMPLLTFVFAIISSLITNFTLNIFILPDYKPFLTLCMSLPIVYIAILLIRTIYYSLKTHFVKTNLVILGNNDKSDKLIKKISLLPKQEFNFLGIINNNDSEHKENVIGNVDNLLTIIQDNNINLIINCLEEKLPEKQIRGIFYHKNNIEIISFMDCFECLTKSISLDHIDNDWLFKNINNKNRIYYTLHKRMNNIITATIILLATSPIFIILYIIGKTTDKGPFFYKQKRIGLNNKVFNFYKIRSMIIDAEKHKLGFEGCENDPRITPVGKIVRPLRLDELPQMINILKGELSIIGPRPDIIQLEEKLASIIPHHHLRRSITQGWSGWAQINEGHSDTIEANKEKYEYDLYYMKHCSLLFDLIIFFRGLIIATSGKHG